MNRLIISALAAVYLVACARSLDPVVTAQAGATSVTVSAPGGALKEGSNTIEVSFQSGGQLQAVQSPSLLLYMPAMGTMQEMRAPAQLEQADEGRYRGKVDLQMGGTWQGLVEFQVEGQPRRADFKSPGHLSIWRQPR